MTRDEAPQSRIDPIEIYDALALAGDAPDPKVFCATLPAEAQAGVLHKLELLRSIRRLLPDLLAETTADRSATPALPARLDGFTLLRPLGRGGMGQVFLARQATPERLCAVKLLRADLAIGVARFEREANIAARLQHPGIAAIYAANVASGQAYIAMELVHGFSLRQLLRASSDHSEDWLVQTLRAAADEGGAPVDAGSPMPITVALDVATQVADALGQAHAQGVIHRDVKPGNIMLTWSMQAKVIDFGLARVLEGAPGETQSGMFVGTWDYAAPEQLRAQLSAVGPWSDTYALGVTLFEMLTQRLPHAATDYAERMATADVAASSARALRPELPRHLDALLRRALSPDVPARFQDGAEMADALRACAASAGHRHAGLSMSVPAPPLRWRFWIGQALWAAALATAVIWAMDEQIAVNAIEQEARAAILRRDVAFAQSAVANKTDALKQCFVSTRKTLTFTPAVLPPRLEAELQVEAGRVTAVRPSSFSRHLNAEAKACMARTLVGLELAGVGMRRPTMLTISVDIPGVGTADDPALRPR